MKIAEFVKMVQDDYITNRSDSLEYASYASGIEYLKLPLHVGDEIEIDDKIKGELARLKEGEPLAYIINNKYFYDLDFYVDNNVLIPRPETEILVDNALNHVESRFEEPIRVLDLCTGSSCILSTILSKLPNATGVGVDICGDALKVAEKNIDKHGLTDRVELMQFDVLDIKEQDLSTFDIITCNPPYLSEQEWVDSDKSLKYEPKKALSAGENSLLFYKKLMDILPELCNKNGVVLFELGQNQTGLLKGAYASFGAITTEVGREYHAVEDYQHIERVLIWTNLL